MNEPKQAAGWQVRSVLNKVHRWLGLSFGVLFAVVSVSGSLLLFQPTFFSWAHGELIPDGLDSRPGSLDAWVENARAAVPDLEGPTFVWPPHVDHNVTDAGMLIFPGRPPSGFGNSGLTAVLVAPDSGKVLGVVDVDSSPAYAPIFFHARLWGGKVGSFIVGAMSVAALGLLLLGIYLWWPRSGKIVAKLSPRPLKATLTQATRLHLWFGIWLVPFLLVLTGTGLYLSKPAWVSPVLDIFAGAESAQHGEAPNPAQSETCDGAIGFDTALARAHALVPGAQLQSLNVDDDLDRWLIAMQTDSEAAHRMTHLIADLKCGTVTVKDTPADRSTRSKTELWLMGLHDGSAFGGAGEMAATVFGLVPLLLAWSGIRMWLRGRRRVPRKAA